MRHALTVLFIATFLGACASATGARNESAAATAVQSASPSSSASSAAPSGSPLWFKGNTHCHTTNSDGDSSPSVVVAWYRDHGYDFLAVADHCFQTPPAPLQRESDEANQGNGKKPFLLIPGEEAGAKVKTTDRRRAVHVGSLGASKTIGALDASGVRDGMQKCVDAIQRAGGIAHINHPNFMWSITADDLFAVQGVNLFEMHNANPASHNLGGDEGPGTEVLWDDLLSRGRLYYGIASDDAHYFKRGKSKAVPGGGWIAVRARELTAPAILDAIRRGDFYASTGVELDNVVAAGGTLSLVIPPSSSGCRTEFIGKNGTVLAVDGTNTPSYTLKAGEMYVRAKVTDSGGRCAWTQPLFAKSED